MEDHGRDVFLDVQAGVERHGDAAILKLLLLVRQLGVQPLQQHTPSNGFYPSSTITATESDTILQSPHPDGHRNWLFSISTDTKTVTTTASTQVLQSPQLVLPKLYSRHNWFYPSSTVATIGSTQIVQPSQLVLPKLYSCHTWFYLSCTVAATAATQVVRVAQSHAADSRLYSLYNTAPMSYIHYSILPMFYSHCSILSKFYNQHNCGDTHPFPPPPPPANSSAAASTSWQSSYDGVRPAHPVVNNVSKDIF